MIALAVRFLAGRYHANPWGRHANEGVVEWPPSPWRLLRALVASWRRTRPELPEAKVAALLSRLAPPPLVRLPVGAPAHTRHFMPWYKKGPDDRTQVLDTFVALLPEEPVVFAWPEAALSPGEERMLADLLAGIPYLGRAESWAELSLTGAPPDGFNCRPLAEGEPVPPGTEAVRVLAPVPQEPEGLLTALMVDTDDLRTRERRLEPPGSRWVLYAREAGTLVAHPTPLRRPPAGPAIHAVRYALAAVPRPLLTEAVAIGEWARRAAQSQYGRLTDGGHSPVLMGRVEGRPMQGHWHAFYLPSDEDGDGWIDHLTVYAPMGLGETEREALARMEWLYAGRERPQVDLALLGLFTEEGLQAAHPWCRPARVWESVTPYVLTRHPKVYRDGRPKLNERGEQVDGPEDQVRREWATRQADWADRRLPDLVAVERLEPWVELSGGRRIHWLDFQRWRRFGSGRTAGIAVGLRLVFAAPVAGPLALGYGCHFGLGQFRPVG